MEKKEDREVQTGHETKTGELHGLRETPPKNGIVLHLFNLMDFSATVKNSTKVQANRVVVGNKGSSVLLLCGVLLKAVISAPKYTAYIFFLPFLPVEFNFIKAGLLMFTENTVVLCFLKSLKWIREEVCVIPSYF